MKKKAKTRRSRLDLVKAKVRDLSDGTNVTGGAAAGGACTAKSCGALAGSNGWQDKVLG